MPRIGLSALFYSLIVSSSCFAQERSQVTNESGNRYSQAQEVFYVLKSDPAIKDGPYQFLRNNKLRVSGFYRNNQKDSVWEIYAYNSLLSCRKWFHQGVRTGKWEFFTYKGEPDWTYDFNTRTVSYLKNPSEDTLTSYYQTEAGAWIRGHLDNLPLPLNSTEEWLTYLNQNFRYPSDAVDQNKQGRVVIDVTVDENGNALDYTVSQSVWPTMDAEALRVVKGYPYEFVPAEKNGKKVKAIFQSPVIFKLVQH